MNLKLTYVNRTERVSARTNKPFTSMSIKAEEYGDKYLSGFGNKDNAYWKTGDTVTVESVVEVEKDGKKYLNFEMPKAATAAELTSRIELLENYVKKTIVPMINSLNEEIRRLKGDKTPDYPPSTGTPKF